jgi:hypothetical protein
MDIKDCRIDMCVCVDGRVCRIDRIDQAGSVCAVDEHGNHLLGRARDIEPIVPDAFRVGDKVRVARKVTGPLGWVGEMTDAIGKTYAVNRINSSDGSAHLDGSRFTWPRASLDLVSVDECESCQKLQGKLNLAGDMIKEQKEDIRIITMGRDAWKADACQENRNAAYWREELYKLQKEALADSKPPVNSAGDYGDRKPLGEVIKIYVQISPSVLAKIIAEREE